MLYQLYKAMEKPNASKYGKLVQRILLVNVLINISVSLLLLFLVRDAATQYILITIEYLTVFFFCLELIIRYILIGYDNRYQGIKGRIKYTFTPFIIIDLLSLIPYFITGIDVNSLLARLIRFLKFFRVLKFIRLRNTIRNIFSLSFFATAPIILQLLVLLIISMFFISVFSLILKDMKLSAMIFLGPGAIAEVHNHKQALFGLLELLIGLIVGGTLISIISSLLINVVSNIKQGYYPYRGNDHIIIINENIKLKFILEQINCYYFDIGRCKDVVLFVPHIQNVEELSQSIEKYSNIKVSIIKGNALVWLSYKKLKINHCEKVIVLENKGTEESYEGNKIVRFILSHENFVNQNAMFAIETNGNRSHEIYEEIFSQSLNSYHIINSNEIVQSLLNRSIVNPIYFEIYAELLSYKDWKLDILKIVQIDLSFSDLYMYIQGCTAIGIVRAGRVILNPDKDFLVTKDDAVIVILRDKYGHYINNDAYLLDRTIDIPPPNLRVNRNICIIGDFDSIQIERINEFLDETSINNLQNYFNKDKEFYLTEQFWNEIIDKEFDMIILNLEDDFEFILTMYLRNKYKDNECFLHSIVNIVHDPVYEQLLYRKQSLRNIILSDEIAANYTAQILFNPYMTEIFKEITSSQGNEFYTLSRNTHSSLFMMDLVAIKLNLLNSNMIYVGAIIKSKFDVDSQHVADFEEIVVLAKGV